MNKNLYLILGCFLASLFFACNSTETKITKEESCETVKPSETNPNGDSELALLMRNMYLEADSIKSLVVNKQGNISDDFILELENVHSAIPTDATVKTPEFNAFNKSLINQAKILQNTPKNQTEAFNNFVNSCIDCHSSFCPGPIKKIEKLIIH